MAFLKFAVDPKLGKFPEISLAQQVLIKCMDGEDLETKEERDIFFRHAGRPYEPFPSPKYVSIPVGRRGGKSRIIALFASKEIVMGGHEKYLAPGETGTFAIVAQDKERAEIIFNYCVDVFEGSPILKKYLAKPPTSGLIRFSVNDKPLEIRIQAADKAKMRGLTIIGFVGDEAAHWPLMGVNTDKSIFNSVRPGSSTIPNAKFVLITTPWGKQGLVWDIYEKCWGRAEGRYGGRKWFVYQAPTMDMNPNLPPEELEEIEQLKIGDPEEYRREYCAEFTDIIHGWIAEGVIDAAVISGLKENAYNPKHTYVAAMDSAFSHDAWVFKIVHRDEKDTMVEDLTRTWTPGGPEKTVDMNTVIAFITDKCKEYKIRRVYADQYAFEPIEQSFERSAAWVQSNARLEKIHVTGPEKREQFGTLKHLLQNGKMSLLDHEKTVFELKNLEVKMTGNGGFLIGAPRLAGYTDDHACALALSVHYAYTTAPKADHEWERRRINRAEQDANYFYNPAVYSPTIQEIFGGEVYN